MKGIPISSRILIQCGIFVKYIDKRKPQLLAYSVIIGIMPRGNFQCSSSKILVYILFIMNGKALVASTVSAYNAKNDREWRSKSIK